MSTEAETENEKLEKIIEWLASKGGEGIRTDHKTGTGFSVFEKSRVHVKGGDTVSVVEWLKDHGFEHGMNIAGYRIVHQKSPQYPESFTFFLSEKPVIVPNF